MFCQLYVMDAQPFSLCNSIIYAIYIYIYCIYIYTNATIMGHRRDHYGTELHFGTGAVSHKSHRAITSQFGRFTGEKTIHTRYEL